MQFRISIPWFIFIVVIIGTAIFASLLFFFLKIDLSNSVYNFYYTRPTDNNVNDILNGSESGMANNTTPPEPSSATPPQTTENNKPVTVPVVSPKPTPVTHTIWPENSANLLSIRLQIPKINLDGAIYSVGLTADGAMGTPVGPLGIGLYNLGPFPGQVGSAVLDGHFGTWVDGETSIFDNLYKLKPGDLVYVKNADGSLTTFVVRELKDYDPTDSTAQVFTSDDGKAHLNLITCTGDWVHQQKTYTKRLVVFTDKQ